MRHGHRHRENPVLGVVACVIGWTLGAVSAAGDDVAAARTYLGTQYQWGRGITEDRVAAAAMFQRGCDGGRWTDLGSPPM